jgi:hypothetical protein
VGGSSTAVILPSVSVGEPDLMHLEYMPRIVPWSTQTSSKRARMDDSSTSASDSKKPRLSSAQIIGSMLLGEHIVVLSPFFFLCLISLVVQMVLLWSFSKVRRKMIVQPLSLVGE